VSRLLLARHGETEWNEQGRLIGWTDLPLTETGRATARALGTQLTGLELDQVWSSDLLRTIETARIAWGEPSVDVRLREFDFGDLEGMRFDDLEASLRSELVAYVGFEAPGGESSADLDARVAGFLEELPQGDHLLVVHAGVMRSIMTQRGLPPTRIAPGELVTVLS
jgi:probable phosphoglycerate mutase